MTTHDLDAKVLRMNRYTLKRIVVVVLCVAASCAWAEAAQNPKPRSPNILLIVADASRRGLQAAVRIEELAKCLNIGVRKSYLVINQTKEDPSDTVRRIIEESGLELVGTIPDDEMIYEFDLNGRPTVEVPEENPAVKAAFKIFDKIMQ